MGAAAMARWVRPGVILVATDLNDLSRLMPFAVEQAGESGGRLILLHVLASTALMATDAAGLPYYDPSGELEIADRVLLPWCEYARQRNVECQALVREGYAAQQIAAAARQFRVDRVLLGTRSRSKLAKLLLGSVADQVLRSVNLPVITVGPEAHLPVDASQDPVVLHATTLRETSRPSAALACQIAAGRHAKLLLLTVLPPRDDLERKGIPSEIEVLAMRELRRLAASIASESCAEIEPVTVFGNPAIEILAMSDERKAGMIVLGATHRSALENLTRDRTVYRVLAHARCPVLTLRESLGRFTEAQHQPEVISVR
jgi:nucleotide-binding universal stress UspA family protein